MSTFDERDTRLAVEVTRALSLLQGDVQRGGARTAVLVTSSVVEETLRSLDKIQRELLARAESGFSEPVPEKSPAKIVMPTIKVNAYKLLSECVERGVSLGWQHAHKHTSEPTEASIKEHIERDVMGEVAEYFSFDDVG